MGGLLCAWACSSTEELQGSGGFDASAAPDVAPTPEASADAAACAADLSTDPKNCGRCAHDCLGGACSGGRCQPVAIATEEANPSAVLVDATHVYWSAQGIRRAPKLGGAVQVLAKDAPRFMAADDASIYWVASSSSVLLRSVPKAGNPDGGLGSERTLLEPSTYGELAVDAANVYVAVESKLLGDVILRVPKAGGAVTPLIHDDASSGRSPMVSDGSLLFYSAHLPGKVRAVSVALSDAGVDAAVEISPAPAYAVTLDPSFVYWTTQNGSVKRAQKDGGGASTIASGQLSPTHLAVDASGVYWANGLANEIVSCPLSGCGVSSRVIAERQDVSSIAVDDASVYWTSRAGGAVMRVAK